MTRRILFVDDEPRILEGLRRMLHGQRSEWELLFATSGEAALAEVGRAPVDVVVSDMRMPGMDGATLLERVATLAPDTIRIVLSGQTDAAAATRAVPVAHQFLTKPCEPVAVREVVNRTCALRDLLRSAGLRRLVGGVEALPSVPAVWHELGHRLRDPASSIDQIATVVGQDAALSAKVLQLVNSSFFGQRREVTTVAHATALLGTGLIRSLTLAQHVFSVDFVARGAPCTLEGEQRHALAVGGLAQRILPDRAVAEPAFTAGLLHDVGKLILASKLPQGFADDLEESIRIKQPLYRIEIGRSGVSHAEVGAYLLGLWGLPHDVVEAVAHHHLPSRVGEGDQRVLLAVHVADALIHEVDDGREVADALLDRQAVDQAGWSTRLDIWREMAAEQLEDE